MNIKDLIQQKKAEFEKAVVFFSADISSVRTGRATPAIVEDIEVNYYDQKLRMKELASITAPEPRLVFIQPWDKGAVEPISGAIKKSDLGLNPVVDGQIIRLNIPPLTEERRRDFVKILKQKAEEAKIKIRRVREEIWDKVQKMEHAHEIREDEKFKAKEELQKAVDEFNGKILEMEKKKEGEIML